MPANACRVAGAFGTVGPWTVDSFTIHTDFTLLLWTAVCRYVAACNSVWGGLACAADRLLAEETVCVRYIVGRCMHAVLDMRCVMAVVPAVVGAFGTVGLWKLNSFVFHTDFYPFVDSCEALWYCTEYCVESCCMRLLAVLPTKFGEWKALV
jgi:hypothetical protein